MHFVSIETTRRVWSYVSEGDRVRLPIRTLSRELQLATSTVHYALYRLRDLGYITIAPNEARARQILVRFMETP